METLRFSPPESVAPPSPITVSYPSGRGGDEVVVARLFRRCNHLLVYGIRFAKLDIIFNSIVEQVYFLEHHADLRHKRMM